MFPGIPAGSKTMPAIADAQEKKKKKSAQWNDTVPST